MRRGTSSIGASLLACLAFAGCGSDEEQAPAACFAGADAYLTALADAPGEVRLEGTTAISDCVVKDQGAGDLGQLGEQTVAAATELNRDAIEDPGGDAAVQLGYLVGAIQEGAANTGGIHEDLIIRLDTAARFSKDGPQTVEFERAYGEGYAAGQESG